jgi:hypothetical protein
MSERDEREDQVPAEEAQSVHPTEPAEGAREPGRDAAERRPPHPTDPAEGPRREPTSDQSAAVSN